MTLEDLTALACPAGQALLAGLPPYHPDQALRLAESLRQTGLPRSLVAAALTQSRLAAKAAVKFGPFAAGLLFTPDGVEQASRWVLAARHADRFRRAGFSHVADLTCGIGGDALALAAFGRRVSAWEIDPVTAAAARFNLRAFPEAEVICGDGLAADLAGRGVEAVFADPGRRTESARADGTSRRSFNPASYSPPLDAVVDLARRWPLGVKTAPGLPHSAIPDTAEAQWISHQGTVLECGLWFGPLRQADRPGRSALVIKGDAACQVRLDPANPPALLPLGQLGPYLLEPDGAIIRSGLIATAAAGLDSPVQLHRRIAYVSCQNRPSASDAALWSVYQVLDCLPLDIAGLRRYLRQRQIGTVVIKQRGTGIVPEVMRRQLAPRGPGQITLVATRLGQRHVAIVVQPLSLLDPGGQPQGQLVLPGQPIGQPTGPID